jgi:hypothetical protein
MAEEQQPDINLLFGYMDAMLNEFGNLGDDASGELIFLILSTL